MSKTIELRDPKLLREFTELAQSIKQSAPKELHSAIFTRLIIASRGMSVIDPVNSPLSIWTINLDAIETVLALRHLDLSGVSHINPIALIDALQLADQDEYHSILETLSGSDPNFAISPKLMAELLQGVSVDILKLLKKGVATGQAIDWLLEKAEDLL